MPCRVVNILATRQTTHPISGHLGASSPNAEVIASKITPQKPALHRRDLRAGTRTQNARPADVRGRRSQGPVSRDWSCAAEQISESRLRLKCTVLFMPTLYIPARRHNSSTRRFTSSDMRITPGQGRVKPSCGHLRVASTPIFEP